MNTPPLTDRILTLVYAAEYRPCKPRLILKQLKLPDEDYRELRRAIRKLVQEGRLLFGANHIINKPGAAAAQPTKKQKQKRISR